MDEAELKRYAAKVMGKALDRLNNVVDSVSNPELRATIGTLSETVRVMTPIVFPAPAPVLTMSQQGKGGR